MTDVERFFHRFVSFYIFETIHIWPREFVQDQLLILQVGNFHFVEAKI